MSDLNGTQPIPARIPSPERLITAKQAEADIPPLERLTGNYSILGHFQRCQDRPPESDGNVLIEGLPGTGKTATILSYLRRRLNNPTLFEGDVELSRVGGEGMAGHEANYWQTGTGRIYAFVRIDGATDTRADLDRKVRDAMWNTGDHTFVLLDEAGELYFRGMEEPLRPMLTAPDVTTYANAQNFHSKRRTDSRKEEDDRLRAFLRRFTHHFHTENPTEPDLVRFLVDRLKSWGLKLDSAATLHLLARKSGGVVGYAIRPLIKAIDEPDRRLSRDLVERYDADPLNS